MEDRKIIGFYDYTVILTYLGFIFAFTGIAYVLSDKYTQSLFCLMFAGVCDMFDGAVASLKTEMLMKNALEFKSTHFVILSVLGYCLLYLQ